MTTTATARATLTPDDFNRPVWAHASDSFDVLHVDLGTDPPRNLEVSMCEAWRVLRYDGELAVTRQGGGGLLFDWRIFTSDCPWRIMRHEQHGESETYAMRPLKLRESERPTEKRVAPTDGSSILITAGIGDAITIDSILTPEERERIRTIYYACPNAATIKEIFSALPNYPRLNEHIVLPTGQTVYDNIAGVVREHGWIPAEDFSISRLFHQQHRTYTGSSLLTYSLASAPDFPPYMVVVPQSSWGLWRGRNFNAEDWRVCLEFLEEHNLLGVMLYSGEPPIAMKHKRLVDLSNQLSILESVEVMRWGIGYMGIDSALSVLAAKLYPASRLAVKSVWGHLYNWRQIYYAPRRDFQFLQRRLVKPTWT